MPSFPSGRSILLQMALAAPVAGQAPPSPYLNTDDPRMPLIEHLIARGEIRDPSPLERPFRKSDIVAALLLASGPAAKRLALELGPSREAGWSRLSVRAGAQAYSQGRRDLLQDGGASNPGLCAEVQAELAQGPLVIGARGSVDTRLSHDPDYIAESPGPFLREKNGRIVDLYAGLQGGWGEVHLGQMARNWGPPGVPGVPLGDAGYPRPDIGVRLGRGAIRFSSIATRLRDGRDAVGGTIERYYVAHRLAVRAAPTITLAAWEVGVIAGASDQLDGTTRAIAPLLVIPALVASKSHRNEMVGGDISWRPSPRLRFEAQLAIDDWNFDANNPYPQRWAGALTGAGALGNSASWRVAYTTASSLAFRTLDPQENIADYGIGIGRLFPDNEIVELSLGVPFRDTWLVTPRLALLRQGEGRIGAPFPTVAEAPSVPARFIGVTANSFWLGLGLAGGYRRWQVAGEGGLRHTTNAGHLANRTNTSLEGRVTATLGFTLWKARP